MRKKSIDFDLLKIDQTIVHVCGMRLTSCWKKGALEQSNKTLI